MASPLLAAALLAAGCGGSGPSSESTASSAAPTSLAPSSRFSDNGSLRNGELPPVYVDPSPEKHWTYVYHIQGEPFREAEFLGLCRTIARDTPAMPVNIVPNTAMSREEIELVRARIRENGLATINVLTASGARRRQ